jgi:hypothetical protein
LRSIPAKWMGGSKFVSMLTTRQQAAGCFFLSCHLCNSHLQLQELTVTVLSQSFKAYWLTLLQSRRIASPARWRLRQPIMEVIFGIKMTYF